MHGTLRLSDFDYLLPEELIAQYPSLDRSASRLMVVHRSNGKIEHKIFKQINEYLNGNDLLVFNDTKVIKARLSGEKYGGGAKVEILLDKRKGDRTWEALAKPAKRLAAGSILEFAPGFFGEVRNKYENGMIEICFASVSGIDNDIEKYGQIPLPPYIKVQSSKSKYQKYEERYQTVYARKEGATAAPTAGLHFTQELIGRIRSKKSFVTLHTGYGTFAPVRENDISRHKMHSEKYEISEKAIKAIRAVKAEKGRVIAVGTTSARLLESVTGPGCGETDIFIYPGYRFKVVDALITNFHLPKSTLIMLVSAFAGTDLIKKAYLEAVKERYRFFSFGDAMLII